MPLSSGNFLESQRSVDTTSLRINVSKQMTRFRSLVQEFVYKGTDDDQRHRRKGPNVTHNTRCQHWYEHTCDGSVKRTY